MSDAIELTARIVQMARLMRTAEPISRVPRAQPPTMIEADYAAQLVGWVREWRAALQPLFDALPDILRSARSYRGDGIRADSGDERRLRSLVDRGRHTATRQLTVARTVADRTARRVSDQHKQQFARQTKAGLGVSIPTRDPAIPGRIGHFISQNVALIQSLNARTLDQVELAVHQAFTGDISEEDLAAQLNERFDIAERHARLIARDQISKLNAQVARLRHAEVGVRTFRWMTKDDSKVRPSHAVKHNRIFPYEGSRAPSFFPGDEVNCRCEEVPLFDEILARAGLPVGRQRVA